MSVKYFLSIILLVYLVLFLFGQLSAQEEIDQYKLFEGNKEFKNVRTQQSDKLAKNRKTNINRLKEIQARNIDIKQTQNTQNLEKSDYSNLGTAVYFELIGKGIFSPNIDFRIKNNHRFSIGITLLEYGVGEDGDATKQYLSPGIMYYYIIGVGPSYFETGVGVSTSPCWNEDYYESPISLHGVIGYRHQKKDGFLFRAGFTPFYRVNGVFFPLIGLSFGYSW